MSRRSHQKKSRVGKQLQVKRRYACPKYLRQTFHEFADNARIYCPWTTARYCMLRGRGMKHHAAIRNLARSWIRILFQVRRTGTPFDCERYIAQLTQRCPAIIRYLPHTNCELNKHHLQTPQMSVRAKE